MAQQRRMVYAKVLGSYHLNTLPIEARYLYVGMLVLADDDGRLTADPRYLKGQIFSYDDDVDAARVEELLTALNDKKVVELYEAEGVVYAQHPKWTEYQSIRKDMYTPSKIPSIKATNAVPLQPRNETVTAPYPKLSKVKLNKVKSSKDTPAKAAVSPDSEGKKINQFIKLFEPVNPSIDRLYGMKAQRDALTRLLKKFGDEQLTAMIESLPKVNAVRGMVTTTTPYQLEANLGKIKARMEQERSGNSKGKKIIV